MIVLPCFMALSDSAKPRFVTSSVTRIPSVYILERQVCSVFKELLVSQVACSIDCSVGVLARVFKMLFTCCRPIFWRNTGAAVSFHTGLLRHGVKVGGLMVHVQTLTDWSRAILQHTALWPSENKVSFFSIINVSMC